jgi:small subunit ribosomal protein S9
MEQIPTTAASDISSATGRRKSAVCRVNIRPGKGQFVINGRPKEKYLYRESLVNHVLDPLKLLEVAERVDIDVKVTGGGLSGQAGAIRLAVARALAAHNPEYRGTLKKAGLLTVDARKVERKKYGRPKARKRFQFSKR